MVLDNPCERVFQPLEGLQPRLRTVLLNEGTGSKVCNSRQVDMSTVLTHWPLDFCLYYLSMFFQEGYLGLSNWETVQYQVLWVINKRF